MLNYLRQISEVVSIKKKFFQTSRVSPKIFWNCVQRAVTFVHILDLSVAAFEYLKHDAFPVESSAKYKLKNTQKKRFEVVRCDLGQRPPSPKPIGFFVFLLLLSFRKTRQNTPTQKKI